MRIDVDEVSLEEQFDDRDRGAQANRESAYEFDEPKEYVESGEHELELGGRRFGVTPVRGADPGRVLMKER